jgi:type VI protein secretion system component VasA
MNLERACGLLLRGTTSIRRCSAPGGDRQRRGDFAEAQSPRLVPIRIAESHAPAPCTSVPADTTVLTGTIEITLPNGCQVRVGNDVTLTTLRRVISVLRG